MLSEDLKNVSAELGRLTGRVNPLDWDIIENVQLNLDAISDGVEDLERTVLWSDTAQVGIMKKNEHKIHCEDECEFSEIGVPYNFCSKHKKYLQYDLNAKVDESFKCDECISIRETN